MIWFVHERFMYLNGLNDKKAQRPRLLFLNFTILHGNDINVRRQYFQQSLNKLVRDYFMQKMIGA